MLLLNSCFHRHFNFSLLFDQYTSNSTTPSCASPCWFREQLMSAGNVSFSAQLPAYLEKPSGGGQEENQDMLPFPWASAVVL